MRHYELTSAPARTVRTNDLFAMSARLGLRQGFTNEARRAETPHIVDCKGLTRTNLTKPGEFEHELSVRVRWCEKHAGREFEIEPIGPDPERLTGRRFRFGSASIAALFKLWFETNLWRKDGL